MPDPAFAPLSAPDRFSLTAVNLALLEQSTAQPTLCEVSSITPHEIWVEGLNATNHGNILSGEVSTMYGQYCPHWSCEWREGDLTKAAMLYEGAFEEWWSHLRAMWRIRQNYSAEIEFDSSGYGHVGFGTTMSLPELCRSVSPVLLRRVPASELQSAETLLPALKVGSRPFRLMDLPMEIRLSIYGYIPLYLDLAVWTNGWRPSRIPSLLVCSRQVRKEALPLAGIQVSIRSSSAIFDAGCFNSALREKLVFRIFTKQLRRWSLQNGKLFVSNMSRLSLAFSGYCDHCERAPCCDGPIEFDIRFTIHPARGLFVEHYDSSSTFREDVRADDIVRKEIDR
jgi:hypothetical protein